jgi:putative redox protein
MELTMSLIEFPFVLQVVNGQKSQTYMDASPTIGGKNKGMRPMELLTASLAGCLSIDLLSVLKKQRQVVQFFEVNIQAIRSNQIPAVLESVQLRFTVNQEVDLIKAERALELSFQKYCSVAHSLHPAISIQISIIHQNDNF